MRREVGRLAHLVKLVQAAVQLQDRFGCTECLAAVLSELDVCCPPLRESRPYDGDGQCHDDDGRDHRNARDDLGGRRRGHLRAGSGFTSGRSGDLATNYMVCGNVAWRLRPLAGRPHLVAVSDGEQRHDAPPEGARNAPEVLVQRHDLARCVRPAQVLAVEDKRREDENCARRPPDRAVQAARQALLFIVRAARQI